MAERAELIKRHGARRGYVQTVHAVRHGDAHGIVAVCNGIVCEPVALRAETERELFDPSKTRIGDAQAVVPQRERRGFKAERSPAGRYVHGT